MYKNFFKNKYLTQFLLVKIQVKVIEIKLVKENQLRKNCMI